MTPLVGKKPWFGPKAVGGWGWAPSSWEGWVVLAVFSLVVYAALRVDGVGWLIVVGCTAALTGICIVKGTSPGNHERRAEFDHERRRSQLVHGGGDDSPHIPDIVQNWEHLHEGR